MPSKVYTGRHGSVLTVDGENLLGVFQDFRITVTQDLYEHHGPQDDWDFVTPRRLGWQIEITKFVAAADSGATKEGTLLGDLVDSTVDEDGVAIAATLGSGDVLSGTAHFTDLAEAMSDDPDQETVTLRGTGALSINP